MGIYLNPGTEGFAESLRSEIYVDKTGLIACTNKVLGTRQKYVCVSRPRRFGKSMVGKCWPHIMAGDVIPKNCSKGKTTC